MMYPVYICKALNSRGDQLGRAERSSWGDGQATVKLPDAASMFRVNGNGD
jgi:hypothetical protein